MPAMSAPLHRQLTPWLAAASLVSWGVALWQSLPRLMAGPICTSNNDLFAFAGHCPACFVAAGFTAALVVSLAADLRSGSTGRLARPAARSGL